MHNEIIELGLDKVIGTITLHEHAFYFSQCDTICKPTPHKDLYVYHGNFEVFLSQNALDLAKKLHAPVVHVFNKKGTYTHLDCNAHPKTL